MPQMAFHKHLRFHAENHAYGIRQVSWLTAGEGKTFIAISGLPQNERVRSKWLKWK